MLSIYVVNFLRLATMYKTVLYTVDKGQNILQSFVIDLLYKRICSRSNKCIIYTLFALRALFYFYANLQYP